MKNSKIVFIGAGNMAEGIIRGQLNTGAFESSHISIYEILESRAKYMVDTYGVSSVSTISEGVKNADIVFIAVRPQDAIGVLDEISKASNKQALILSICAGITLDTMNTHLSDDYRIARIMPNVLIEAQNGYSGVCVNANVTKDDKEVIEYILKALGQTMFIPETLFDEFTAFSCAGPAYVLYFANALIDAGVQSGFSREDSRNIVLANLLGTSQMLSITGSHPYQIVDTMTSPAGVTIEGLKSLNEDGFTGSVMRCVETAVQKAKSF